MDTALTSPNRTLLLGLYRRMRTIRRFEERTADLRRDGDIVGSVHLCNGQEAICVGTADALDLTVDVVFPTYRGHGWGLACGVPPAALFAEMMGRRTGMNGGRGGSAYNFAPDHGMYGENSIVGAGTVIATGAALASTFDGSGRVSVAVIGDGAMNQGAVHEALNFAASRSLPVLFVVENNLWSEMTPISATTRKDRLFTRGNGYGIPAIRIDGNDVLSVTRTMREVISRIRSGGGPILVEAMTARLVGHYIGDIQHYRQAKEIEDAKAADPLIRTRQRLLEFGCTPAELDVLDAQIDVEIDAAARAALAAPFTDPSTVTEHLYA
ncbi:thiamine pyrophosphate-dependent dehydrogenase E1 component subunit alpha [Rathayibacter sp. VKM Ac-2804]|uniref:thiamine pyrophosphate-dependent dehydrogenase E1 component subunit alpha n=1 Tax=Rathayibacter sp. VKM Ac-2804 TaxID=2609257 RepID=UPI001422E965|nr:thiamine pyrophosphate-dependent dehydrogenase E1 component subunit alpha [Rathayibacter sp. VKM Ac-2804]